MRMRSAGLSLLVILGLLAAPLAAEAQQAGKVYRVGFLIPSAASGPAPLVTALRDGLRALGYVEGQNLVLERRYAETPERLPELAADLVRAQVDIIITVGSQASQAAQRSTSSVPIVMVGVVDPVAVGLVTSLAHPEAT